MATIETAVRAMLVDGTTLSTAGIPDARVTHGYRLQETALPAATFEVDRDEILTIGASPLRSAQIEVRVIAPTTADAVGFISALRTICVPGTYDTIVFDAVIDRGHAVDGNTVGDGDEANPAELTQTFEIYYRG